MKSSVFLAGTALALTFAGAGCGKRSSDPAATAAADAGASSSVASAGLSVCIDSSSSVSTMGRKLAEAVAQAQGVTLGVHEFDGSGSDDEGFEMKNFVTLAGEECQLVLGFPLRDDFVAMHAEGQLRSPEEAARLLLDLVTADDYGDEPLTRI